MTTNTAYDLSRFESNAAPRIRVIKSDKEVMSAQDRKFAVKLAVLAVAAVCLAVYTVYGNMLLTNTKAQITHYSEELTELQSENVYLDYQIESMLSAESAEEYAENTKGLIKLAGAQVVYVNIENENKIVEQDAPVSFRTSIASFMDTVLDMVAF